MIISDICDQLPDALASKMGEKSYELWGDRLEFDFRDATLYVYAPNPVTLHRVCTKYQRDIVDILVEKLGKAYPIKFLEKPSGAASVSGSGDIDPSGIAPESRLFPTPKSSLAASKGTIANAVEVSGASLQYGAETSKKQTADYDLLSVFESGQSIAQTKQESAKDMMTTRKVVGEGSKSGQVEPRHPSVYSFAPDGSNTVVRRRAPRPREADHRSFASYNTFVKGISNQLATQVADIAISSPGMINPIFISGSSGVGKTHLLQGIWDEYRKRGDRLPPRYLRAEQFTTLFIQSLMKKDGSFRRNFENISLFILDDLQFLQGKRDTQIEFLSLFDHLRAAGIQLIISADRPLNDLNEIRPEIRSRILSGGCCSIELPEKETLLKIFNVRARQLGLEVPDEVARYVVSRFSNSAPQLSGVLNRLLMARQITRQPITLAFAETALSDLVRSNQRLIRLEDIEKAVQETFGLPEKSLRGRSRVKQIAWPRMLAFWLARKYTRNALSEIGRYFGNRSHSTVVSAQKKIDLMVASTPVESDDSLLSLPEALNRIERLLQV
ncbi:MAG: DnaA/Hda family protein [Planctomycetia bacterium]|nr:DnaA/Hda family protein [Planctomycetia bacterium]